MAEMKQLKITDDVAHKLVREGYVADEVLEQTSIEGEANYFQSSLVTS